MEMREEQICISRTNPHMVRPPHPTTHRRTTQQIILDLIYLLATTQYILLVKMRQQNRHFLVLPELETWIKRFSP